MNQHEEDAILTARIYGPMKIDELMQIGKMRRKTAVAAVATLYESGYLKRISDSNGFLTYDCTKLGKQAFHKIAASRSANKKSPRRRQTCQQYKDRKPS